MEADINTHQNWWLQVSYLEASQRNCCAAQHPVSASKKSRGCIVSSVGIPRFAVQAGMQLLLCSLFFGGFCRRLFGVLCFMSLVIILREENDCIKPH